MKSKQMNKRTEDDGIDWFYKHNHITGAKNDPNAESSDIHWAMRTARSNYQRHLKENQKNEDYS